MTVGSIVKNAGGVVVGRIEDRVFLKHVYGSKHMVRIPMGWAIDADIFDRVIAPNCYSIHIIDRETGTKYIAGVDTFTRNRQPLDRGHGKQYFLNLIHWESHKGVK